MSYLLIYVLWCHCIGVAQCKGCHLGWPLKACSNHSGYSGPKDASLATGVEDGVVVVVVAVVVGVGRAGEVIAFPMNASTNNMQVFMVESCRSASTGVWIIFFLYPQTQTRLGSLRCMVQRRTSPTQSTIGAIYLTMA